MDYSGLFRRAYDLIRRKRALLILGILLALVGGGGGATSANANFGNLGSFGGMADGEPPPMPSIQFEQVFPLIVLAIIVIFVLAIIATVFRYIVQAGLIDAIARADDDEDISVRAALSRGASRRALNLFLADIILIVPVALIGVACFMLALVPLAFGGITGASQDSPELFFGGIAGFLVLLLPLIAIFTIVGILVGLILQWARRAVVLNNVGPIAGVKAGWGTLRNNVIETIVLWIFQLVIGFVAGIAVLIVSLVILAIGGAILLAVWSLTEALAAVIIVGIPVALVLWVLASIVQGIFVAYIETYWTLAWLELTGV